jgi:hypothetical protein
MKISRRAALMNGKFEPTSKNQDDSNLHRPPCPLMKDKARLMPASAVPRSRFREDVSCGVRDVTMGRHDEVVFPVRRMHAETSRWCDEVSPNDGGVVMREDFASSGFLVVIVVSLIVVCAGFLALGI